MNTTIEDVLKKHLPEFEDSTSDLKNAIYAAMQEYASLNRQGWTMVEDGLPEDGSTVLVTNGERVKEVFFSKRTSRDTPTFIFTTMKKDEITHWMKLPEPPK